MLVVSTSSVVWSQVRQFFVLEYFCTINHDEITVTLVIINVLLYTYHSPMFHNIVKLHNNSMFTLVQKFRIVQ